MDVVFPHFVYDHTHGVFPWNTSDRIGILQFPSIYHRSVIYSRYVMYQSTLKQSPSEHVQSVSEHNVADFFNIMALVMSLLQLLSPPLFIATISVLKLVPGAEDVAKERTIDLNPLVGNHTFLPDSLRILHVSAFQVYFPSLSNMIH